MALGEEGNGGGIPATMLVGPTGVGNNAMPYPYPVFGGMGMGGNSGMGNGFGDGAWSILLILIVLAAGGGWGNGMGNGGGFGGQPIIVNDGNGGSVQRGFDQAATMAGLNGIQSGIANLSTQLCGCCGDISTQLCNGFSGVNATVNSGVNTIAQQLYTNTIADLERSFASQTASTQGMTALQSQLAQCCCDNRLATNDLKYTIAQENCADRAAISDGIRDLLAAQTAGFQSIKDLLFEDRIDEKNDKIASLERQLTQANLAASQLAQTAQIVDQTYNRFSTCPVGTVPVFGEQPIFRCNNNNGCGCGCGGNGF